MTAEQITKIVKKWHTTIDFSLSDGRKRWSDTELAQRQYALRVIEYILKDIEKKQ